MSKNTFFTKLKSVNFLLVLFLVLVLPNTVSAAGPLGFLADITLGTIAFFIFSIANTLLGLAGLVLNFVVVKTIFEFSTLIGNSPGLLVAWGILRDIGNMALLFGFVFIGLSTILNNAKYSFKKALPRLLIFAVLINFSLFAAEAVIDTSNVFSSVMYSQASANQCPNLVMGGSDQSAIECGTNYGIAGHILQSTGLSSVWNSNYANEGFAAPVTMIGLAIFSIVGAVVLLAAAIMLVIRAVTLTFVMVSAPIGFAGMALPPFKKFASRWWKTLFEQAFFAPILLLLIFISLKITDSFSAGQGSLGEALANSNTSSVGIIFVFTIIIAFMIASLTAAKSFGANGAKYALSTSKKVVGFAPGIIGRNTVGRAGANIQKKYENSGAARKLRSIPVLGAVVGKPLDDGITAGLKKVKSSKYGGTISFTDREKKDKERKDSLKAAETKAADDARKDALKKELDAELKKEFVPTDTAGIQQRDDRVARILSNMSAKEVEELDSIKKSGASLETLAKNLTPEKFAALVKDGNAGTSETQKEMLKNARFKDLSADVAKISDPNTSNVDKSAAKDRIKQYSAKDLQNAPTELLGKDDLLKNLSDSQREDLIKSGNVDPSVMRGLRQLDSVQQVKDLYQDPSTTNPGAAAVAAITRLRLPPKKVAKLGRDILVDPQVAAILTPKMLSAIQEDNSLLDADVLTITANINASTNQRAKDYVDRGKPTGAYWN